MSKLFSNQDYGRVTYKHTTLPIYVTDEFRFWRCVTFHNEFYGKTISDLHKGNLRSYNSANRYSKLFPNRKTSYWADSIDTARAEVKYHDHSNNLLTFFAYDDLTSTFPILPNEEPIIIIDGREIEFQKILLKIESEQELSKGERFIINEIDRQNSDCLVFESIRKENGLNYIFFEKGFNKLSIREVDLKLGDMQGKNNNYISCAVTSDYSPIIENYGKYFLPLAKIRMCEEYLTSNEYLDRNKLHREALERIKKFYLEADNDYE